jgi:PAS domain S-box-containing protein
LVGATPDVGQPEQPYRQLLELLPVAVYTCAAPAGTITFYNAQAAALWGRAPRPDDTDERFCGSLRLFWPDGRPLPHDQTPMAMALAEGRPVHNEDVLMEQPSGRRIVVRVNIDPIRDQAGRVVGAVNVFEDVTERRRAEHAQAHLAAVVESSDDAIVTKSLEGTITSWNAGAARIFGYSAEEAVGRSITLIIPPDRYHEEVGILERLRRGERIDHYETIRRRRDGSLLDISISVSPVRDASGRIVGASKIARDITAQKMAAKALAEEGLVRDTLAHVGAALAAELDQEKLVQAITDAGTALTGAEFGAFFFNVSHEVVELSALSGADREAFAQLPEPRATALFAATFRGEGAIRVDDVTADPRYGTSAPHRGVPLPARSYLAVPVTSRSGNVLGGLFFGHSQAGQFQPRHEQLAVGLASSAAVALDNARLYKEAQDANRVKDEFLATLSHELRTPLNAMLGWAQMLRSMTLQPETEARALESIERNARAQAQLVEDLLDISRIVSGKLQIHVDDVDLARVVLEAIESVRPALVAKRLELQLDVPGDLGALVKGDADRLRQVAWNLLSNATKFTPAGGQVTVRVRVARGHAELAVTDTGIGIPREFLGHVFERFRQAESTVSRRHGGLGLGLAIVRHLTEAHGGTVDAESAGEGQGATFVHERSRALEAGYDWHLAKPLDPQQVVATVLAAKSSPPVR